MKKQVDDKFDKMIRLANLSLAIENFIRRNEEATENLCYRIDKSNGQLKRAIIGNKEHKV